MDLTQNFQRRREELARRVEKLRRQGVCYSCYDLETGELFGDQHVVYEDELFKVVLDLFPRMWGIRLWCTSRTARTSRNCPRTRPAASFKLVSRW